MLEPKIIKIEKSNTSFKCLIQCLQCGKLKWRPYSEIRYGFGQFCSRECAITYEKRPERILAKSGINSKVWKGILPKAYCKTCNKELTRAQILRRQTHCSRKCGEKDRCGEKNANWKEQVASRFCKVCNNLIPRHINLSGGVFCSRKCLYSWMQSVEGKNSISKASKENWQKPEYRKKNKTSTGMIHTEEWKTNQKHLMKKHWQDPDFAKTQVKTIMKAAGIRPNKTELLFEKFLNTIYPNEYKYVGDGEFILGGKCPDYLNINGKKKLIELYGDYWHKGQNPQDRIDYFKRYGFDTLVVWEKELKNLDLVKQRLSCFMKGNQNVVEG